MFRRLGSWCHDRRKLVVVLWIAWLPRGLDRLLPNLDVEGHATPTAHSDEHARPDAARVPVGVD
jgi:hypothetical protein